jgi:hypothetical protein
MAGPVGGRAGWGGFFFGHDFFLSVNLSNSQTKQKDKLLPVPQGPVCPKLEAALDIGQSMR